MANRNHKPESHSAAKINVHAHTKPDTEINFPYQRQLKVRKSHYDYQYADFRPRTCPNPEPVPWVNIKGYWLKQAGFAIGTELQITIRHGEIVISVSDSN